MSYIFVVHGLDHLDDLFSSVVISVFDGLKCVICWFQQVGEGLVYLSVLAFW